MATMSDYFVKLSHGTVPKKDAMKYEALRLGSFQSFPSSVPVSSLHLASAGFFYANVGDEVECYSCGLKLKDWSVTDNPFVVHKRYSQSCPFITNNVSDNVPLASRVNDINPVDKATENLTPLTNDFNRLTTGSNDAYSSGSNTFMSSQIPAPQSDSGYVSSNITGGNEPSTAPSSAQIGPTKNGPLNTQTPSTTETVQRPVHQSDSTSVFPQTQQDTRGDYRYERARLGSFQNWPSNAAVRPEDLARSGFYYTGSDDRVQCTFCRGILRNWEPGDQPEAEHRRHFGQCPFLNSPYDVGNVSLGDEYGSGNKNDPLNTDYCRGIVTEKPVHYQYSLPAERLATFKDFPANMTQSPEQFTRSGFFYSGISDHVKCFFCDGGLRNWEPNDDPWTEHARWFPRCGYLRLCKGDEYIKDVQNKYAPPSAHHKPPRMRQSVRKFDVDPRKLKEHLNGRIVAAVKNMGCEESKIKEAVRRRMQDLGDDFFPNAESLLDAILEYEDEMKYNDMYGDEDSVEDEGNTANPTGDNVIDTKTEKKKNKKKKKKNKKSNAAENNVTNGDVLNVVGNTGPLTHLDEDEAKSLAEDVQRMKDERLCKICMDEEVNIVFLRCGHLVCCSNCAPALRHCPICRELIRGTVRVFLS